MSTGFSPQLGARPIVAAVLTVAAAGLLIAGSFLPSAVVGHFSDGSRDQEILVTSWTRTFDPAPQGALAQYYSASHVPIYGIPLALGAAALLAAALVSLLVARRSPGIARTVVIAAAAMAVAVAFMLAMDVESTLSYEGADPTDTAADRTVYDIGVGFWLVVGGAVLALAAGVLMLFRPRSTFSDATPPLGFRAPMYPPAGTWPPAPGWQQPSPPQGFPQPPVQPGPWPPSQPSWQPPPQQPGDPYSQPTERTFPTRERTSESRPPAEPPP